MPRFFTWIIFVTCGYNITQQQKKEEKPSLDTTPEKNAIKRTLPILAERSVDNLDNNNTLTTQNQHVTREKNVEMGRNKGKFIFNVI